MPLQPLERIEDPNVIELQQKLEAGNYERVFLAEGDSWFDIFTPSPLHQPNLLNSLRVPWRSALVDISHVGDTAEAMATGTQAAHTRQLLDMFTFNALLLSAGGNDLKDAFMDLFMRNAVAAARGEPAKSAMDILDVETKAANDIIAKVCDRVAQWIGLRSGSKLNQRTPVILHGYDYLQPRPAGARLWIDGAVVKGPWIYPVLKEKGASDEQMREKAHTVIDKFNEALADRLDGMPGVYLLNTRNTLTLAAPGTDHRSNDWMDEIHPTPEGFDKLASAKWNPQLTAVCA
jgi:hypothetical protein